MAGELFEHLVNADSPLVTGVIAGVAAVVVCFVDRRNIAGCAAHGRVLCLPIPSSSARFF